MAEPEERSRGGEKVGGEHRGRRVEGGGKRQVERERENEIGRASCRERV